MNIERLKKALAHLETLKPEHLENMEKGLNGGDKCDTEKIIVILNICSLIDIKNVLENYINDINLNKWAYDFFELKEDEFIFLFWEDFLKYNCKELELSQAKERFKYAIENYNNLNFCIYYSKYKKLIYCGQTTI